MERDKGDRKKESMDERKQDRKASLWYIEGTREMSSSATAGVMRK